jgi:hypothetical protein
VASLVAVEGALSSASLSSRSGAESDESSVAVLLTLAVDSEDVIRLRGAAALPVAGGLTTGATGATTGAGLGKAGLGAILRKSI